jgi:hypothetical protein
MKGKINRKRKAKAEGKGQKAEREKREAESGIQKVKRKKGKAEERLKEWKRAGYFFEWFGAGGTTQQLWKILKLALLADNDSADERERSNTIFFYEQATEFFKTTSAL